MTPDDRYRVWRYAAIFFAIGCWLLMMAAMVGCTSRAAQPPRDQMVKVIHYDEGGELVKYDRWVTKHEAYGSHIRFSGECHSACTIYLRMPPEKLCVDRGVAFVFHEAFYHMEDTNGVYTRSDAATAWLWSQYPPWVQDWIMARGGLTRRDLVMTFATSSKHIQTCEEKWK